MTTLTTYAARDAVLIGSQNADWYVAAKGNNPLSSINTIPSTQYSGCLAGVSYYQIYQYLIEFDTSTISAGSTVDAVSLSMSTYSKFSSSFTFNHEFRTHNFGTTFEAADWVYLPTTYAGKALAGSLANSAVSATRYTYNTWPITTGGVVKAGPTRFLMGTSAFAVPDIPPYSSSQYDRFYAKGIGTTYAPYLTVSYTAAATTYLPPPPRTLVGVPVSRSQTW